MAIREIDTNYPPVTILGCHTRMLRSTIVDDEYELSIYLPPSYESSEQTYPTLYVLDSPTVFGAAVTGVEAFMRALSARALPNLKFKTLLIDGLGHAPAALPSLVYGIEAVYAL